MKGARFLAIVALGLVPLLAVCDGDAPSGAQGLLQLTFQGDVSFQGPHGGQTIYVAVIRGTDGVVVARESGTVSATEDPAFSFTFPDLLEAGTAYQIHYWIDSNFGGGTVGVCDPKENDHQWSLNVPGGSTDRTVVEDHDPIVTMDVCSTFT